MAKDDPALKNIQQKYSWFKIIFNLSLNIFVLFTDNVDKTMYVILHGSNSKALSLLNL